MSGTMQWLDGRRALLVGAGAALDAVAQALTAHGATVATRPAAADEQGVAALFAEGEAQLAGPTDFLVHAGVAQSPRPALDMGIEEWRAHLSADLDSRFLTIAEFARRRIAAQQPGAVLLLMPPTASRNAGEGTAGGALDNLVKSLGVEWARDGIRVNAIATRHVGGQAADESALASLGHLAAYILSDYGAYVTGTTSGIDELPAG